MKRLLILGFLILAGLAVWSWVHFFKSFKEPVFITIKDIKIHKMEGTVAEVSGIAVFNNPNAISAKLLNTELKAYSNDVQVGQISQTNISDIPAGMNFEVPLKFNTDLLKLGMSQSLSGIIEKMLNEVREVPIRFEGYCRIKNNETIYKIPITYEDKLIFK
jgi:LEA14-like dessication related protein